MVTSNETEKYCARARFEVVKLNIYGILITFFGMFILTKLKPA